MAPPHQESARGPGYLESDGPSTLQGKTDTSAFQWLPLLLWAKGGQYWTVGRTEGEEGPCS